MRLGVLKELKPRLVATFSDKAGSHEGHPFLVEAAVSLGGTQVNRNVFVVLFVFVKSVKRTLCCIVFVGCCLIL